MHQKHYLWIQVSHLLKKNIAFTNLSRLKEVVDKFWKPLDQEEHFHFKNTIQ